MLPSARLLPRLEHRLPLLTGGASDLPARQQTLRDAIAWSFDLLDPGEKSLFQRLAVFAGGCTLDAAEAIAGDPANALDEEYDNLRAALQWLYESGDVEKALRFGDGIWPLWWVRGYQAEGQIRRGALLALPGLSEQRTTAARIHNAAGTIAFLQGDFATL